MYVNFDLPAFKGFDIRAVLPPGYRGPVLQDGQVISAVGAEGNIILQSIQAPHFDIRFMVLDFVRPITLAVRQQAAQLVSFLAIKDHIRFTPKGLSPLHLQQGQFALLKSAGQEMTAHYQDQREYQSLEITWSTELLQQTLPYFDALKPLFAPDQAQKSFYVFPPGKEASYKAFDLAQHILRAPYQPDMNRLYLEYKVMEYLLLLLDQSVKQPAPQLYLTEAERERILNIGITVSSQPDKKFPISLLAMQAHMNEMKLKMGFKDIHGKGIFEYQLAARMKEAHRLLKETDLSTKAIASMIGYKLTTSFITKFREFFGYPPSAVSKKR